MIKKIICNVCCDSNCARVATLESEADEKKYSVIKCRACGLVFTFPIPDFSYDSIQDVYGHNYTDELRQIEAGDRSTLILREAINRQMEIVERHVQKGVALNVGAMGSASQVLEERGWNLHIVEVSEYAAETARMLWGFDVIVSRIEDFDCPPDTYDFIKLGHVIEHLADPRMALEKLGKLLRSGGVILIDTDNAQGLKTQVELAVRKLMGERLSAMLVRVLTGKNLRKRYGRLAPPEHLYCFTERSLVRLLEHTGFEIIQTFKAAWGDDTWFPLTHKERLSVLERVFIVVDQVGAKVGLGEVVGVLARKR